MRNEDLVSIIKTHRADSLGSQGGALSNERATALDHYYGRPYGTEQEGRSAVVSKDLAEAVDWAMPAIMDVFVNSGNVAEFDPIGPEDEESAQVESDVVNKVFIRDNDGFLTLHDAIKDILLLKNGYIKHFWDETEESRLTEYTGLSVDEVTLLFDELKADGAEVSIEGHESRVQTVVGAMGPQDIEVFDLKLRVKSKTSRVCCVAVPPEEIRVSRRCRGPLSESPFVEHVTRKTRSDLIKMGMPKSFVDNLAAIGGNDLGMESLARDSVTDENSATEGARYDKSMDEIEYCEAYIRVDWDGDGIAELRKVVTVSNRIPPGAEWNEEIDAMPISGGVAKRIPHRHVGESLDDDLADLQEIKTVLLRQMLDNIYSTNNNQWLVNERANLSDFLESLPGGIKRIKGLEPIAGSVEALVATPIMQQIMPAIDYIDNTKEARTGINKATTGLDPDVLKQSTKGAFMENLNRASQKVEMMARMLAETLVKPTMLAVHALLIKHQDKAMQVRLRGKFITVNPQEWKHRSDMVLRVGIGTGNEEDKRAKLMMVAQAQQTLAQLGLVGPKHGYNLFSDFCRTLGFDMPEKYAMDPDSAEFMQKMQSPPTDPRIQIEQMRQQDNVHKFAAEQALEDRKAALEIQTKAAEQEAQAREREYELQLEAERNRLQAEHDAVLEAQKMEYDARVKEREMEMERWKAALDAEVKLTIATISATKGTDAEAGATSDQASQMLSAILERISAPKTHMIMRDEMGRPVGVQQVQ